MIEKALSAAIRRLCAGGALLGAGVLALPAQAQSPAEGAQPMQKVEIVGTSIRQRLASQTALPISTIRAEDFAKQGLSTVQEVLATIPMNQTSTGSSQSVGSGTGGRATANLRGLGSDKTLVLLNGRRLANHPFFADTVDLNIIPVAALERVEVLRDGASAIYGSDAIGGVINFVTKRSYQGMEVSVEAHEPAGSGGADEQRINFTGGWGNLATDGYNLLGVVDFHRQSPLMATDRDFARTGVRPERGLYQTSGTTFPANFYSDEGIAGNPSYASGCRPPYSIPNLSGAPNCRFDSTQFIDLIPLTKQETFLGRFSKKLGTEHTATLEYLHSRSTNEARVAPPPLAGIGLTMSNTSPFYPGAGITPAVAGLTGEPLDVSWRPLVTGKREGLDVSLTDRLLAGMEGTAGGWDYNLGLSYAVGRARSAFTNGYVVDARIIEGVGNGLLNPFGEQTPAGNDFLRQSLLQGEYLRAKIKSGAIDFKASRELMTLPAGALGFALGGEFRRDEADYRVNRALASQASSSGYADAQDQSGSRNIGAVFTELNIPVIKDLEVNLAARYDDYTDFGHSFNPKVALRWQPSKQVLLRGSFNKGFRAPTLYDLHGPQTTTNTGNSWNDPVLCPGGTPAPGANPNISCDQQQNIRGGGNPDVKPERSRTYSAGIVLEPTNNLTLTGDYWDIRLKDQISALAEESIFSNYQKYQNLYFYNAARTRLDYVLAITQNLGEVKTRGVDLGLLWRLQRGQFGNFTVGVEGTYVDRYDYQNERNGPFTVNAGRFADASPVFRWRHTATLGWTRGPVNMTLSNRYLSGYDDQPDADGVVPGRVGHYSTWTLAGTYTANQKVSVTAGVKNLLDDDPPFTLQSTTFQQGYDPRYTDPIGRTFYVRATYKF
ncbi:TonB-dependent receptor [Massilia sp. CCM 8734]|uniref:TonB-dependent receptor n=1 Tax=Massilia sp. CCM 8734 TaxID=2609283 RepID=UPI00142397DC|nr:TonB-dependent receptor [Massilia sp. CCM 8734]NHZ98713.1 TonB-dependent receptor [Massilia sp. CCM 8734]